MKRRRWIGRVFVVLAYLVPGAAVMGTSCAADVRDTVIDAGVDFVGDSVGEFLDALFPVSEIVAA